MVSLITITFIPFNETYAATQSTLTITSKDLYGNALAGAQVVLYDRSGVILQTSFTPSSFLLNNGQTYRVQVYDYGSCHFDHWADTGSSVNPRIVRISIDYQFIAVYDCPTSTTTTSTTTTSSDGGSGISINSINQNGNAISGYYTVLYNASGNTISTGFTPTSFLTTSGGTYGLGAASYGSCTFSKWSDGLALNPRSFTASNTMVSFTAVYNCGTSTTTTTSSSSTSTSMTTTTTTSGGTILTINSQMTGGGIMMGMYTILQQNGAVVATGFTPVQFSVTKGQTYSVEVQNYGTNYFQYWADTGSVNALRTITPSSSASLTAVFCNGPPGTCSAPTPVNGITVYVHRISASYWTPCFALSCSAGTGPGASMYVVLYDSTGAIVQTGFANEQGYTFTGLAPGATYYLYPTDCDLCHGSTHDVVFSYWGANVSTVRPLAVTVGSSEDAWYSCTNGCQ